MSGLGSISQALERSDTWLENKFDKVPTTTSGTGVSSGDVLKLPRIHTKLLGSGGIRAQRRH